LNTSARVRARNTFQKGEVTMQPMSKVVQIMFSPALLDVIDVMGRRVASRSVGSLGAGRHVVDFGAGLRLAPGMYFVRLTQGASARTTRVTVLY